MVKDCGSKDCDFFGNIESCVVGAQSIFMTINSLQLRPPFHDHSLPLC